MRLDYALYGLAIVLFASTAITFALVTDGNLQITIAAATAAIGLVSIVGGYALRPKGTSAPTIQTVTPIAETAAEPVQQAPAVETPVVEAQTVEEPKMETPAVESSTTQSSPVVEAPKAETASAELETDEAVCAPAEAPAPQSAEVPTGKGVFAQIRGISEKRAEQLRANGVNNLEDLAKADPEDLAAKLDVSPRIMKMWIGCAKKLIK
ncbi:MAG: hypothetical protein NWF00_03430 [Candidatus Bathyarchaeota archaeon]|nr:hypothetical protein [Candidatus Bathyarchaeota archaeon]